MARRAQKQAEPINDHVEEKPKPNNHLKLRIDDLKTFDPLTENQKKFFNAYKQGDYFIGMFGSPGVGKAQPLDAKILTPDGWCLMGDISIGDNVVTPHGKISKVVGVFPQGSKDIYELTLHDGSKTRACDEHLWEVWYPKFSGGVSEKHISSTEDIIQILESGRNVSIDLITPHESADIDLPIEPYLLGVLIGDGGMTHHISITSADQEIVDKVSDCLDEDYTTSKRGIIEYAIVAKLPNKVTQKGVFNNIYKHKLNLLGLYGKKSSEKFIPPQYKMAGLNQKLELIRGLMDTDGTVDKRGGVSFTTTSARLANDLRDLLWSVGAVCSITNRWPTYTYNNEKKQGLQAYTLHIAHPHPKVLFSLERKKTRCRDVHGDGRITLRRRISSIEWVGVEEAQCIMIDDPNHLYITDDYIVTHNTFLALLKGVEEVLDKSNSFQKVVVIRSAVQVRDQGFVPGTLEEKMAIYETPYIDICHTIFGRKDAWSRLREQGHAEFISTTAIRGMTLDDAIIIVDECQSMTWHELNSVISRCGYRSKIIFVGDLKQNDLLKNRNDTSGLAHFLQVARTMKEFTEITFTPDDIVRSSLVKSWIIACENFEDAAE